MRYNKDFRLEIPSGWHSVVNKMLNKIEKIEDEDADLYIACIKEKFGGLRVYYTIECGSEDTQSKVANIINTAEYTSYYTCAECGNFSGYYKTKDYILPFCIDCAITLYETDYRSKGKKFSECFDIDFE